MVGVGLCFCCAIAAIAWGAEGLTLKPGIRMWASEGFDPSFKL